MDFHFFSLPGVLTKCSGHVTKYTKVKFIKNEQQLTSLLVNISVKTASIHSQS